MLLILIAQMYLFFLFVANVVLNYLFSFDVYLWREKEVEKREWFIKNILSL